MPPIPKEQVSSEPNLPAPPDPPEASGDRALPHTSNPEATATSPVKPPDATPDVSPEDPPVPEAVPEKAPKGKAAEKKAKLSKEDVGAAQAQIDANAHPRIEPGQSDLEPSELRALVVEDLRKHLVSAVDNCKFNPELARQILTCIQVMKE
jgi:hypothetical protein